MKFSDYIQDHIVLENLHQLDYIETTPVQHRVFDSYKKAKDLIIISPTGTGKTEAYCIPLIDQLLIRDNENRMSVLIIVPTRELVIQTHNRIQKICKNTSIHAVPVYGGQAYDASQAALDLDPEIVIATPGRLLDVLEKGWINFKKIRTLVIDEVDELLALGFQQQMQKILGKVSADCSKWLVSATINSDIQKLAGKILNRPIEINIQNKQAETTEKVLFVDKLDKKDLIGYLIEHYSLEQTIVFTRTTHGVDRIEKHLRTQDISCAALYGDKKQSERETAIEKLKDKEIKVLIATDIATRGIDIPSLQAVINYEIPDDADTYIHRIGRSTRGFDSGLAFTFCDHEDNGKLIKMQSALGRIIPVEENHPYMLNWQKAMLKPTSINKKKRR